MKIHSFTRAILGLALATAIPLATVGAPITHAGSNPSITATWKAGVLTVGGSGFANGDSVDVAVYNGLASAGAHPLATAVVTALLPNCAPHTIWCILEGAMIHTSFTSLNPGACDPNGLNILEYQVVAFDQTAGSASEIATVYPTCGTGNPTAPQSGGPTIAASLNAATGVITMGGKFFTAQGSVTVTLFQDGQPVSTVETTASAWSCGGWLCFPPSASASFATGVIGCANHDYTVVAVDEATNEVSNEAIISSQCTQ